MNEAYKRCTMQKYKTKKTVSGFGLNCYGYENKQVRYDQGIVSAEPIFKDNQFVGFKAVKKNGKAVEHILNKVAQVQVQ